MKKRDIHINKKAQVSLFLILSILMLIFGAAYFVFQTEFVDVKPRITDPELVPIKTFVEGCIKIATDDGLERIGLSGGFAQVPKSITSNPQSYLSIYPKSGFIMPYWWYNGIDAIPTQEFIKQQLVDHVQRNMVACLEGFDSFKSIFDIEILTDPAVAVEFNEDGTSVEVNYELDIKSKNKDFNSKIKKFSYASNVRFKKVYELAKSIMERENNDYFLEKRTIDLYSIDPDIPTTDIDVSCQGKTWRLSNIKDKLTNQLRVNLPFIRIKDTDYSPNLFVPNPAGEDRYSETYYNQHYIWKVTEDETRYNNMKVSFTYDNWPLEINARPNENGVLKSNARTGENNLRFFCLHIWHFTYDISYPILVSVFDKETSKNDKYQFNFAFKVDVDHNRPNRVNKGSTLYEAIDKISSEEYCKDVKNEITVFTVDNATGQDIKDVNLTFVCGKFACDMGQSDWLSLGAASGITKRFPYCVNGIIRGYKEGYMDSHQFIQTDVQDRLYVLFANPVKEFSNYNIVKHPLSNPASSIEIAGNEKASILIKSNKTGYETFAFYPPESDFKLKIPSGKDEEFLLNVYLLDDESIKGGYIGQWKVNKDDLNAANEITFHVLENGDRTEEEKAQFVFELEQHTKDLNIQSPEFN